MQHGCMSENSTIPTTDQGGRGGGALLQNPKHTKSDAALIRRAASARWPITDSLKRKLLDKIEAALDTAEDARDIRGLGQVIVAMEAQRQADEHLDDKNSRLDSGKATENIAHRMQVIEGIDAEAL